MSKRYSFIYSKLVKNSADIVGLIAYTIYKRHKIEQIMRIRNEFSVPEDVETQIQAFTSFAESDSQIERYLSEADDLLLAFADSSLESHRKEIEDQFDKSVLARVEEILPSSKKAKIAQYWVGVSQGVVASIIFVFVVIAIYAFTNGLKLNPAEDLKKRFFSEKHVPKVADTTTTRQITSTYDTLSPQRKRQLEEIVNRL